MQAIAIERPELRAREVPGLPPFVADKLWDLERVRARAHQAYREVQQRLAETEAQIERLADIARGAMSDAARLEPQRAWAPERLEAALVAGQLDDVPNKTQLPTLLRLRGERDRLRSECDAATVAVQASIAIHAACDQWASAAARDWSADGEPVRATRATPRNLAAEVERIRTRVAEINRELRAIPNAPLPRAEAIAALRKTIRELAAQWNDARHTSVASFTRVSSADALLRVPSLFPNFTIREQAACYLCAVHGAEVEAFYVARLEALPLEASAIAVAERAPRLAKLRAEKWDLEVGEESLVLTALGAGTPVTRRGDADPAAVLRVVLEP